MTRFTPDERGTFSVLAAMMISALMGMGALAIDVSFNWWVQSKLQAAADSAALAAAQKLPDTAAAAAAAVAIAPQTVPANFGTVIAASDVQVGSYDTSTGVFTAGAGTSAVQVIAGRTTAKGNRTPVFLAGLFGWRTDINARAVAYRLTSGPAYCVIVLDSSSVSSLGVTGGGTFSVPNCGVQVNSSHNKAASAGNATNVTAKNFCIKGGYNGSFSPTPVTGCAAMADPLASIPEPTVPTTACTGYTYSGANCYWTGSITISGNQTLSGSATNSVLYFKNATVSVASGANITSSGLVWFFDSTSSLSFGGNGTVNITAPTSGTYKGMSLFQSRSATINNSSIRLTGSSDFVLDGTIYVPRADLQMTGTSDVTVNSKTGYVVANKLSYTGASTFTVGTWGGVQALGTATSPYLVQ
jgi:Flp pilus assembly protein TadG